MMKQIYSRSLYLIYEWTSLDLELIYIYYQTKELINKPKIINNIHNKSLFIFFLSSIL